MKIWYGRVSTIKWNLESQIDALEKAGCDKIFVEKKSASSKTTREELASALNFCREGDTLIVTRLDRLARSVSDLLKIVETLENKKVWLFVVKQNMDTTTPTGRLTFKIIWAIAEFERELINERRLEWQIAARARWVQFGRKPKLTNVQKIEIQREVENGRDKERIMQDFDIKKTTFYDALNFKP